MLQCFDEKDNHPKCNKQFSNIHGKTRHLIKAHQNTRKEMWHKICINKKLKKPNKHYTLKEKTTRLKKSQKHGKKNKN